MAHCPQSSDDGHSVTTQTDSRVCRCFGFIWCR
jgi:hypothetical protein